jgi:hypothetical protein
MSMDWRDRKWRSGHGTGSSATQARRAAATANSGSWSLRLAILLALLCGAARASSPSPRSQAIERIRRLYSEVNESIRLGRAKESVFFTDGTSYSERRWKEATSDAARATSERSHFLATVYSVRGAPAKAVFRIRSPSGDWQNTTEYYFYSNGATAFRFERHFTYLGLEGDEDKGAQSGPYVVERRRYFDYEGRIVRDVVRASVESTKREVSPTIIQQIDTESYSRASDLPFAHQIK